MPALIDRWDEHVREITASDFVDDSQQQRTLQWLAFITMVSSARGLIMLDAQFDVFLMTKVLITGITLLVCLYALTTNRTPWLWLTVLALGFSGVSAWSQDGFTSLCLGISAVLIATELSRPIQWAASIAAGLPVALVVYFDHFLTSQSEPLSSLLALALPLGLILVNSRADSPAKTQPQPVTVSMNPHINTIARLLDSLGESLEAKEPNKARQIKGLSVLVLGMEDDTEEPRWGRHPVDISSLIEDLLLEFESDISKAKVFLATKIEPSARKPLMLAGTPIDEIFRQILVHVIEAQPDRVRIQITVQASQLIVDIGGLQLPKDLLSLVTSLVEQMQGYVVFDESTRLQIPTFPARDE